MKKHLFQRMACIGLSLALALGMCACKNGRDSVGGGKTENSGSASGSGPADGEGAGAKAALAKENVYRVSGIELPVMTEEKNAYLGLQAAAERDGRIYAVLEVQGTYDGREDYRLMAVDRDGGSLETFSLELPEGNAPEEDDSEKENDPREHDDGIREFENIRYRYFVIGPGGRVYGIREYEYSYNNDKTGETRDEHSFHVCGWDRDGSFLWQTEIPDLQDGEDVYIQTFFVDGNGVPALLLSGQQVYQIQVGEDGVLAEKKRLSDELAAVFENSLEVWFGKDNSLLILHLVENGQMVKTCLSEYDFESDVLGGTQELGISFSWGFYDYMTAGENSDLIFTDSSGIYRYTRGDAQRVTMMNYINSDIAITTVSGLIELDGKSFFAFYRENYEDKLKAGIFTYTEPEDIPDRAVVTLAGNYVSDELKMRAIEFNKTNSNYKVVVKEYHEYSSYDDQTIGYTRLNNDIISGRMPDILVPAGLPMDSYIKKGLIADVNELIAGDGELSRTEFMTNVFDAYSVDGKLCYVVPSYYVVTMAAKASLVGDGSDWSIEKMRQVLEGMGEGVRLLENPLAGEDFMNYALNFCMEDFVDRQTGTCNFDSEEFIALMEFANSLAQQEGDGELSEDAYRGSYETRFLNNQNLMMELYIYRLDVDLWYRLNGYLGGDFSLVGFPSKSGNGGYLVCDDLLALSAVSENPEGAWEFARYYLTEEYQRNLFFGLPVNREVFMEEARKLTQRSYDLSYVDGEQVKNEYDEYLNVDGEEIVVPPLSQEQMEQVVAHIESIHTASLADDNVRNILSGELGGFFSGQKSAEDTARVIQSRVRLYIQENQ